MAGCAAALATMPLRAQSCALAVLLLLWWHKTTVAVTDATRMPSCKQPTPQRLCWAVLGPSCRRSRQCHSGMHGCVEHHTANDNTTDNNIYTLTLQGPRHDQHTAPVGVGHVACCITLILLLLLLLLLTMWFACASPCGALRLSWTRGMMAACCCTAAGAHSHSLSTLS
jgi:hypothetical protein